jgi:hypothetical protein
MSAANASFNYNKFLKNRISLTLAAKKGIEAANIQQVIKKYKFNN